MSLNPPTINNTAGDFYLGGIGPQNTYIINNANLRVSSSVTINKVDNNLVFYADYDVTTLILNNKGYVANSGI